MDREGWEEQEALIEALRNFLETTGPKETKDPAAGVFERFSRSQKLERYGIGEPGLEILRALAEVVIWQQEQLDDLEAHLIPYT